MANFLMERLMENALQDKINNSLVRIVKSVNKMADQQGGGSAVENYQLLGKRVIIVLGVGAVVVQVVGYVVSRRREDQRIERIVRRVLEEEREKEGQKAQAEA